MQKVIPFISLLLLSSCGGSSFVSSVMNKANTSEIIAFKNYLQQINVMNDFKEYRNNNYPKNDTVIRAFFKKYKIQTLVVKPCVGYWVHACICSTLLASRTLCKKKNL